MFRPRTYPLLLLVAASMVACGSPEDIDGTPAGTSGPGAGEGPPPIILISIDTLRSDRLPAYGYDAGETPAIDAFRRDAVLFERAFSPVPLTLPAHVSMLTGMLPPDHGVRDNLGYAVPVQAPSYLPNLLGDLGYATGAAVSAFPLGRVTGFDGGFEIFEDRGDYRPELGVPGLERSGAETLASILPWLRRVGTEKRPFFLLFHIYEPHYPYTPPEPFASRLEDPYDGEVAEADRVVGLLLDELRQLGVYDRAAIVLISDHGEGLMEHGEQEHGVLLYRGVLQVPLMVKLPENRRGGTSVADSASLVDLAPTLLELAGAGIPTELPGSSLVQKTSGGEPVVDRPLYAETFYPRIHLGWSELVSVVQDDHQYLEAPRSEAEGGVGPELFDLAADPAQTRNLFPEERRRVGEMRQALRAVDARFENPGAADEASREALASLGYISGGGGDRGGPLPDPREWIHVFESLKQANLAFDARDFERAADLYRRTVEDDPSMVAAWTSLGRSLLALDRPQEAVIAFGEALGRTDDPADIAREAFEVHRALGQAKEARALLDGLVERFPGEVRLRYLRAQLAMGERRFDDALVDAEAALGVAPGSADAVYLRGTVQIGRGDLGAAEKDLRRALELEPRHTPAMSDLAILLGRRGDLAAARELLREVVRLRPEDTLAARNLAQLEARLAGS
ncbi:MAG: sulfatase-like hydrolase/transferase [Acidobacteriota bacterium]